MRDVKIVCEHCGCGRVHEWAGETPGMGHEAANLSAEERLIRTYEDPGFEKLGYRQKYDCLYCGTRRIYGFTSESQEQYAVRRRMLC